MEAEIGLSIGDDVINQRGIHHGRNFIKATGNSFVCLTGRWISSWVIVHDHPSLNASTQGLSGFFSTIHGPHDFTGMDDCLIK